MKKNTNVRIAVWAMLFVGMVFSVGCSKDAPLVDKPVVEDPTANFPEFQFYTRRAEALVVETSAAYRLIYNSNNDGPPYVGEHTVCGLFINLQDIKSASQLVEDVFGDRKIVTKPLPLESIRGIDVITNADYDDAHPAGSSLADIMEIDYIGDDDRYHSMGLNDYFATYVSLQMTHRNGFVCQLFTTTPSADGNEETDLTLKLTMGDGTVITIMDIIPIEWTIANID